ncbi:Inosine-5-monophosphate dehydrogenase [Candidatus Filomicrobium marinum]|uniref:Inosine-5-monophosphate dehydrogenase n=2 Tax=Filomicrobium TaxID=119044 RepID=A0A0D6JI93_9HYPH|nr:MULTISPECIES: CBS domain-containing protein [Filomicrobium]MCV0369255.1 CBS domain-containing protein [Filomicrobium sp.]CFX38431.1 Inosine-5-monophosphate dehydrogenase [Candidatus Filomicrobium marinum]CPR21517.1 Inosine-5-monophosphate dehydrogenase [Candidatus Filomicrobium marinum]SDP29613.1 CBS domain-containing protein [Filomicrobium insigne]
MNVAAVLKAKGRAVAVAGADTTLLEIASQLAAKRIGALVIVNDDNTVIGIISERDIVRAIAASGEGVLRAPVSTVMTKSVVTCEESVTLDELMGMMTKGRFRHAPVVMNGELVGVVSIGDVVKHHLAEVEMQVSAMQGYLATG